jgi:hypothetical protein
MSRSALVVYIVLGLSAAAAKKGPKTYEINLPEPARLGSAQLQAGGYKIHLEGAKAVFSNEDSRQTVEANVVVHNAESKYDQTAIMLMKSKGGDEQISEIRLEGTRMKLDFPN